MITLDTHTAVWWIQDPDALSASATAALARAQQILIPAIVYWEVALLVRKGRLRLSGKQPPGAWARQLLAIPRVREVPLDHALAIAADAADMHSAPADRFIATTSISHDAPLVTKDKLMRDLGWLDTVW